MARCASCAGSGGRQLSCALLLCIFKLVAIACPADGAQDGRALPLQDGNFLVGTWEGSLQTDSGAPATPDAPDLYISMPNVLLTGQALNGSADAPAAPEMEERQCAAACRATPPCNVFYYCPLQSGCTGLAEGAAAARALQYRHCQLMQEPAAAPDSGRPPEAVVKGEGPAGTNMTSGQIMPTMNPPQVPGYETVMAVGWFNMYDFDCPGTIKPGVCMLQGPLQQGVEQCNVAGIKCLGIKWFPLGRDYLGPNIFMLKGIPDAPTAQNYPGAPMDLGMANWNGDVIFYSKQLNASDLAAAKAAQVAEVPGGSGSGGDGGGSALSTGAIVGIALGATAAVAAAGAAAFVLAKRRRKARQLGSSVDVEKGGKPSSLGKGSPPDSLLSSSASGATGLTSQSTLDSLPQVRPGELDASDLKAITLASSHQGASGGQRQGQGASSIPGTPGAGDTPAHAAGTSSDGCTTAGMSGASASTFAGSGSSGGSNALQQQRRPSFEASVAGLGKEWFVDLSQLQFVRNANGQPLQLGVGGQGVVYKALLNGIEPVAAKVLVVGTDESVQRQFLQEALLMRQLRHRNLLTFCGVALCGDKALLLTEYMEGRDLMSALPHKNGSGDRPFGWYGRGKRIAMDVAAAIAFLHRRNVVHFDIKSSNVLLTRDLTAKVSDVGLSRLMTQNRSCLSSNANGMVGTFAWCAPEILMGKRCGTSADIYSFGVLLWEICTGELPRRGRLSALAVPGQCPQEVADLIMWCMNDEPSQRPAAQQLVERLSALVGSKLVGPDGTMSAAESLESSLPGGGSSRGSSSGTAAAAGGAAALGEHAAQGAAEAAPAAAACPSPQGGAQQLALPVGFQRGPIGPSVVTDHQKIPVSPFAPAPS